MFVFEATGGYRLLMGRDAVENDELLRHGWSEDVWFHVDRHSSAHVYVRLPVGSLAAAQKTPNGLVDLVPAAVVEAAAQLTKQNSIDGCKASTADVVYTAHSNLKKSADADAGSVGFVDERAVHRVAAVRRDKALLKQLEATRKEVAAPEWRRDRADRDREEAAAWRAAKAEKEAAERAAAAAAAAAATDYFDGVAAPPPPDRGDGTISSCRALEEDFM